MRLTGQQVAQIDRAIQAAYNVDDLVRAIRIGMDEDLYAIVSADRGFATQVFHLIRWAEQQKRIPELLRCLAAERPRDVELTALASKYMMVQPDGLPPPSSSRQPQAFASSQHSAPRFWWGISFVALGVAISIAVSLAVVRLVPSNFLLSLRAPLSPQGEVDLTPAGAIASGLADSTFTPSPLGASLPPQKETPHRDSTTTPSPTLARQSSTHPVATLTITPTSAANVPVALTRAIFGPEMTDVAAPMAERDPAPGITPSSMPRAGDVTPTPFGPTLAETIIDDIFGTSTVTVTTLTTDRFSVTAAGTVSEAIPGAVAVSISLPPSLTEQLASAVVRIRGCVRGPCDAPIGSGVFVHPSGMILTSYDATQFKTEQSTLVPSEFLIDRYTSGGVLAGRYKARVIAHEPDKNLALLAIYADYQTGAELDRRQLDFPYLPINYDDVSNLGETDVVGYFGWMNIRLQHSPQPLLDRINSNRTLYRLRQPVDSGFLGSPVLSLRDGAYSVAGVVLGDEHAKDEFSLVRSVAALSNLQWNEPGHRVVVDDVVTSYSYETEGFPMMDIGLTASTLDYAGRTIVLDAYFYNTFGDGELATTADGEPAIWATTFTPTAFLDDRRPVSMRIPVYLLEAAPDSFRFRLIMSDPVSDAQLWISPEFYTPDPYIGPMGALPALALPSP
jgi:hypothetical protein